MPSLQCLGRLVKDTPKGVHMLEFQEGGLFHLPIRCDTVTRNGDLCDTCFAKEKRTLEKVKQITGTTIQGMLPSYLMGRVTEPIPFWSRLYGGAWYNLKIASGYTLSEEAMVKAKKAAAMAYEGVTQVEPQAMPAGGRKTKKVEAPVAGPAVTPVPTAVKKRQSKKGAAAQEEPAGPPVAIISDPIQVPVETIREIRVRKHEIEGRSVYLGQKDKVYDLKFKYLGRLKGGSIVAFPDSDQEV